MHGKMHEEFSERERLPRVVLNALIARP